MVDVKSNVNNEIQVLKSRFLLSQVVKELKLNVKTLTGTGFKATEIFEEAPFEVIISNVKDSIIKKEFAVNIIDDQKFRITDDNDYSRVVKFGDKLMLKDYNLLLTKKPAKKIANKKFTVEIISEDAAIANLAESYDAVFPDKDVTTIDLTLNYPHPKKGEVILQEIMNLYLYDNQQNRIRTADSTLAFINNRIALVGSELSEVEKELSNYRSANDVTNIEEQSRVLLNSSSANRDKLREQEVQAKIINDLERYLKNPSNDGVIPSSLSFQDASFSSSITLYNQLILDKEKQSLSYTEDNPVIINLNKQIATLKANLIQNVASYKNEIGLKRQGLASQEQTFSSQTKNIPGKERVFLDYSRQQTQKQELYVYLLQKREEAALLKTSKLSSTKIVDNAKSQGKPYKPQKAIVFLMAAALGLVLPFSYISLEDNLKSKISSKDDLQKVFTNPIIGEISFSKDKKLVIDKDTRTVEAEAFRSLRANLTIVLNQSKSNVLMITSSSSGEGKTFTTLNLANAIALTGKKVIVVDLDLRMGKLSEDFGYSRQDSGFSDFINSEFGNLDTIIKESKLNTNFQIITSGSSLSNPSELLSNPKLERLIEALKVRYDYIIIDSSPVGLVADPLLIEKYVDLTLFIARRKFTNKSDLINTYQTIDKRLKNMYLIFNDAILRNESYYGYKNV